MSGRVITVVDWPDKSPEARAIAGAAGALLTSEQRQALAICARRAYDRQAGLGLTQEAFDEWRQRIVEELTGLGGLRKLSQGHYGPVMARMVELAGGTPYRREERAAGKGGGRDDADRARGALRRECERWAAEFGSAAGAEAYCRILLQRIHDTEWSRATAKQVWQVLFTLRNRGAAKRRQRLEAAQDGAGGV